MEDFGIKLTVFILSFSLGWVILPLVENRKNYLATFKKNSKLFKKHIPEKFLIATILGISNVIALTKILNINNEPPLLFISLAITFPFIFWAIFVAVYDIKYLEVPDKSSLVFIIFLTLINVLLAAIYGRKEILIFDGNLYSAIHNFAAAIIYAGFILFIVILTKGRGMGGGDIRIAAVVGLILGKKILMAFYITSFVGLFVALAVALVKRKFKDVQIPFVPLMIIGALISFLFYPEINSLLFSLLRNR